jgi:hypothetical protein
MMQPTVYHDSQYALGLSPRTCEARVDAAVIMPAAGATGDRPVQYRGAGIGRGGYAP